VAHTHPAVHTPSAAADSNLLHPAGSSAAARSTQQKADADLDIGLGRVGRSVGRARHRRILIVELVTMCGPVPERRSGIGHRKMAVRRREGCIFVPF
jgi:hypothetical protein